MNSVTRISRHFRIVILLAIGIVCSFAANAQTGTITANLDNKPLQELIRLVERQSDYTFFYESHSVDVNQAVSVDARGASIEKVLSSALQNAPISYSISGKKIILTPKVATTSTKDIQITGRVTDAKGESIIGASIIQKDNASNGVVTDLDGNFTLTVPAGSRVVVSSLGYQDYETAAAPRIEVTLEEDSMTLDDVVVIGYGTVKKKDLTGAISQVKADKYSTQASTNALDMLSGKIAGFNSSFGTSASGSSSMQIRGQASLAANNTPLVVLDGVIFNGSINDISPNDIETIDILKDASSAAVYGARSAAGVVIITTKHGSGDDLNINFSSKLGVTGYTNIIKTNMVDGYLQRRADFLARTNSNYPAAYYLNPNNLPDGVDVNTWQNYDTSHNSDPLMTWLTRLNLSEREQENYLNGTSYDWFDICTRPGIRQDYNASLSNGNGKSKYYVSLGRTSNKGFLIGDEFKTTRARVNVETNVTDYLKVGVNAQFSDKDNSSVTTTLYDISIMSPLASPYDENGKVKWYPTDDSGIQQNPLVNHTYRDIFNVSQSIFSNMFAELKLPFGFNYKLSYINRYNWGKNYHFDSSEMPNGDKQGGIGERINTSLYEWQVDNLLSWRKTFGVHDFYATFLWNMEKNQSWSDTANNTGFDTSEALSFHQLSIGSNPTISDNDTYSTGNALMARLNYTLMGRYLLTASVRRDGYSAFGANHPYAVFPSGAFAWVLSDEPFFTVRNINNLKLRASYGLNGNRDIGIYSALAQLGTSKYLTDGTLISGIYSSSMANADLKWEKTASLNLGVDFGLFNNRLTGTFDYYDMSTTDLLLARSLPAIIGYKSVMSNMGQLDNTGLELTLNSININKENLSWTSGLTVATNRNKIVHLYGEMIDVVDENGKVTGQREADDITNGWFIGESIDRIWDYKSEGIYQLDEAEEAAKFGKEPGDVKLKDVDGDGTITQDDKVFQGYKTPRVRLGLSNDFTIYKNWLST